MKRTTLLLAILLAVTVAHAQLSGDGYYRVQNVYTSRYARVIDSYGNIDVASTTADMTAIQTIKKFDNVCSDPASIIYIEKKSVGYNLHCQGTNTYSIIGYYPLISDNGNGSYKTYAERAGMVAYLADEISSSDEGVVVSNSKKSRDWYILPFSQADERWFGVAPDINNGNVHALSFFAEFPFSMVSSGMKASIVTKIDDKLGVVVYKEWKGEVPGATPVIILCSSSNPSDNRLDIHTSSKKAPKENLMKGVYFCNPKKKTTNPHHNVVNNDPATMRILGITADGSLGFIRCKDDYLPRNHAWINVPSSAPAELKLVTEEEYANLQPAVIDEEAFSKEYGDGWYQMTNVATGRKLILQSKSSSSAASLATLAADDPSASSHPGSIFRIEATEGGYSLRAQGVNLTSTFGTPFRLWKDDETGAYLLFSTSNEKDSYIGNASDGKIVDEKTSALWKITPVGAGFPLPTSTSSALPTWTALCVDFPCTLSEGSEAYIITAIHTDSIPAAILQPLGSRAILAGTPVFVQCSDKNATLTIGAVEASMPTNNLLQGNLLPYSVSTSYYTLGETVDGLQLSISRAGTIARNNVIIPISQTEHETLPLLSQADYDALVAKAHQEWEEKEAARKEQERIMWFANNMENGWYRLWKKGTTEYLTLTSNMRQGLISKADADSDINSDAGSIFRIDADPNGEISLHSQGVDVSALLGGTVYMRHNDDDSFTITGIENTWTAEYITGIANMFMPEWNTPIIPDDIYGSLWKDICFDFPFSLQGAFELYIPTAVHETPLSAVEWKRVDDNDPYGIQRIQVPAGMPVLIRWMTGYNTPLFLWIEENDATAPAGNLLQGNFLATPAEGSYYVFESQGNSVVFRRSDNDMHPANAAWLPTSSYELPDSLSLMTKEEYDEVVQRVNIAPILDTEDEQLFYTPSGIVIRSSASKLQPGIYITDGRKIVIK